MIRPGAPEQRQVGRQNLRFFLKQGIGISSWLRHPESFTMVGKGQIRLMANCSQGAGGRMKDLKVHRKDLTARQFGEQADYVRRIDIDRKPEPLNRDPGRSFKKVMAHITRQSHTPALSSWQRSDSVYADKPLNDKALTDPEGPESVCYTCHTPLRPGRSTVTPNTLAMRW
jgi:hypothetical protein